MVAYVCVPVLVVAGATDLENDWFSLQAWRGGVSRAWQCSSSVTTTTPVEQITISSQVSVFIITKEIEVIKSSQISGRGSQMIKGKFEHKRVLSISLTGNLGFQYSHMWWFGKEIDSLPNFQSAFMIVGPWINHLYLTVAAVAVVRTANQFCSWSCFLFSLGLVFLFFMLVDWCGLVAVMLLGLKDS